MMNNLVAKKLKKNLKSTGCLRMSELFCVSGITSG